MGSSTSAGGGTTPRRWPAGDAPQPEPLRLPPPGGSGAGPAPAAERGRPGQAQTWPWTTGTRLRPCLSSTSERVKLLRGRVACEPGFWRNPQRPSRKVASSGSPMLPAGARRRRLRPCHQGPGKRDQVFPASLQRQRWVALGRSRPGDGSLAIQRGQLGLRPLPGQSRRRRAWPPPRGHQRPAVRRTKGYGTFDCINPP